MASDIIESMFVIKFDDKFPTISVEGLRKIIKDHEDELPEECFLTDLMVELEDVDGDDRCCSACETYNDYDAKYCKDCGKKFDAGDHLEIKFSNLAWVGSNSVETFDSIFVKKVVPLINGRVEVGMNYGDGEDEFAPWKSCYFVIYNGRVEWISLSHDMGQPPKFSIEDIE